MDRTQLAALNSNREKKTGRFTHRGTSESATTLLAIGRDGIPVGSRAAPAQRTFTHAIIADAETERTVRYRSEQTIQHCTKLLSLLEDPDTMVPQILRAGNASENMVGLHPPRNLRQHLSTVFADAKRTDVAISVYRKQVSDEQATARARVAEARTTLAALDAGTYQYDVARVLRWVTSFQLARRHIADKRLQEEVPVDRLFIGAVMEEAPAEGPF